MPASYGSLCGSRLSRCHTGSRVSVCKSNTEPQGYCNVAGLKPGAWVTLKAHRHEMEARRAQLICRLTQSAVINGFKLRTASTAGPMKPAASANHQLVTSLVRPKLFSNMFVETSEALQRHNTDLSALKVCESFFCKYI